MRNALNALELPYSHSQEFPGRDRDRPRVAEGSIQKKAISVDESPIITFELLLQVLEGSDSDAALYYSERLIAAGCDPMLIAEAVVHASEDVGLADPQALAGVVCHAGAEKIGLPEGRIPSQAIIYV